MATTTWTQTAGMSSDTEADNVEAFAEQAKASKVAAAASAVAAAASEASASASEAAAETAETNAETAETNAAASAATATTKAAEASTSASNAAASATTSETAKVASETAKVAAQTAEANAETAETNAETAQAAAETAQAAAEAAKDAIDGLYLGAQSSDPTVDGLGAALTAGDWYYNTTSNIVRIYDGSVWVNGSVDASVLATAAQGALADTAVQPGDLETVATSGAYADLSGLPTLGTAAATASTDYATAAQGTLADSAVQPSDSPSFGSITVSGTVDGRDVAADGTKLDGIEASADVTDTANVTSAGALMDSEVTNLAQVKAFDSSDYATAAQGTKADTAFGWGNHATAGYGTTDEALALAIALG